MYVCMYHVVSIEVLITFNYFSFYQFSRSLVCRFQWIHSILAFRTIFNFKYILTLHKYTYIHTYIHRFTHIHAYIHTILILFGAQVAVGPGEVHGVSKLADHFRRIAERGGQLEEVDKMTTTTGTHPYIYTYIYLYIHTYAYILLCKCASQFISFLTSINEL